jgi:branched-chain amino acid transport system substrate-binding protein
MAIAPHLPRTLLVACLLAASSLAGCSRNSSGESAGAPSSIVVGAVLPLTGPLAPLGLSARKGMELAIKEANAAQGVKPRLELQAYDDQSKPEEAANAVIRLVTRDRAKLILGEIASSNSLAMAPVAQANRVPMLTISTHPKVTELGNYIFRINFSDAFQGRAIARLARERLKLTRLAILTDMRSDYSIGLSDSFARRFVEEGGQVIAKESYMQGDSDFRAPLTNIRTAAPEAVFIPGYYVEVAMIARQAREIGMTVPLIGGTGWSARPLIELGGDALDGTYFTANFSPDNPWPEVQTFTAKYQSFAGAAPDALAALGYVAARLAADAIGRAPDLSGSVLREVLAQTKDFAGPTGVISFDETRGPTTPAIVMKISQGKASYMWTIDP